MPSDLKYLDEAFPGFLEARDMIAAEGDSIEIFEFRGDKFEFYRFVNRYRVALRFEGVKLKGFGIETQKGYSALTRNFMAYSAFERYADLAGISHPFTKFFKGVPNRELSALAETIDRNDSERKLFDFLRRLLYEDKHREALDRFRGGEIWSVIYYASALRHMYVHGHVTAFAQGCSSEQISMICNEIARRLLYWVQGDFARRLKNARKRKS